MKTGAEEQHTQRRPGGRSARVREAVVAATVAELQEQGYDKLNIAAVAARAGVHETSIYRRWKTREGLVTEATFALFAQKIVLPDRGSLIDDLVSLMVAAGRHLSSPLGYAAMQFALATRKDPVLTREMHEHWALRFRTLKQVFERAAGRGEWPRHTDPWPLMQGLIGAVYLRVFVLREPVTPAHLRPLVASLLMQSRNARLDAVQEANR
ncbi:TetR/AcrR family transcriptional regulator [Bradyrhizobium retamae]|uniref:TetR family transcriptional regulator n=1 Tax=Bradyrhizobium retamae TaxID=1300035 RepID=A0A0R3MDW0_9BRAD|nr:TetR/AcrR family transcriptional regulator [Bradyrhizobium retamae]KRR18028.1 TetR family transcriptional regulator [Bradyrhizobium retamae]